jgi:hypothetical protein
VFYFWQSFATYCPQKQGAANPTKVVFGKNGTKSPYFKFKKLESQDLDHNFKDVTRVSNLLCSKLQRLPAKLGKVLF